MKKFLFLSITILVFISNWSVFADEVYVQVRFTKTDPIYGEYQDAIYYTQAEYKTVKQADIEKVKQERFDNWKNRIQTTSNYEPTKEDLQAQLVKLIEQQTELQKQIDEK